MSDDMTNTKLDTTTLATALTEAWDPPPGNEPASDKEPGDECACGGEDSAGRPRCNCADSCVCDSCGHSRYASTRICGTRDCHVPAKYQVKAWTIANHSVQAKQVDPSLTADNGGDEWVDLDETPLNTWSQPACSYPHARDVVAHDRGWRERAGEERRMWYEIATFQYEPHYLDLPEDLAELREIGRSLEHRTRELARAGYQHTTTQDPLAASTSLRREARRLAAKLVRALSTLDVDAIYDEDDRDTRP